MKLFGCTVEGLPVYREAVKHIHVLIYVKLPRRPHPMHLAQRSERATWHHSRAPLLKPEERCGSTISRNSRSTNPSTFASFVDNTFPQAAGMVRLEPSSFSYTLILLHMPLYPLEMVQLWHWAPRAPWPGWHWHVLMPGTSTTKIPITVALNYN